MNVTRKNNIGFLVGKVIAKMTDQNQNVATVESTPASQSEVKNRKIIDLQNHKLPFMRKLGDNLNAVMNQSDKSFPGTRSVDPAKWIVANVTPKTFPDSLRIQHKDVSTSRAKDSKTAALLLEAYLDRDQVIQMAQTVIDADAAKTTWLDFVAPLSTPVTPVEVNTDVEISDADL